MAITPASFVPERRDAGGSSPHGSNGGGPSVGHATTVNGGMNTDYNHNTDSAMSAMHESMPANHPVTGTPLPKGTGAGQGRVRGGRG